MNVQELKRRSGLSVNIWLVQRWWYRDEASQIVGVFATRKAAQAEVSAREAREQIWTYDIKRFKVRQ